MATCVLFGTYTSSDLGGWSQSGTPRSIQDRSTVESFDAERAVPSLGPTDVDSEGEVVEEDFRPDGGVRGIVVGDIFRRLVARTMAKQISKRVEAATAPFQYALKTKAGCECVAHVLQTLTDLDPEATVMSIDGVGISCNAMFEAFSGWREEIRSSPLCDVFTAAHPHICGKTRWVTQSIPQGE